MASPPVPSRSVPPPAAVRSGSEQAADCAKAAFLSTMSHELRTPLNAIVGFTEVMLQGLSGPLAEEQARQLRIVRDSAARLRGLVEDVLDISTIEAGDISLEVTVVDLRALVDREVAPFAAAAARKGLGFVMAADAPLASIQSDERRIGQVVANMLSNAIKFTDNGCITVGVAHAPPDRIEVVVEDTGVGIPATALQEIFVPFVRVPRPGGRLRDGAGLGLALSRNVARVLGGDVEVTSELGRGSRFTFWLPVRRAVAA